MYISKRGEEALRQREGVKLHAYRDTRGNWTIGAGHTGPVDGIPIHASMTITMEKVDELLLADLKSFCAGVTRLVKTKLEEYQFDACVSLAYNMGLGGFSGSLVRSEINKGRMGLAAQAFLAYEHPPELRSRREEEMKQFEGKLYK